MQMNRRDVLKLGAVGAAATVAAATLTGCSGKGGAASPEAGAAAGGAKMLGKHQIVVIGGGIGGLTVANNLKKKNKDADVLVIEKNDTFMSCPVSNTYLGKCEGMTLKTFVFDYAQPIEKHGYNFLSAAVNGIDRANKVVQTTSGAVGYDILVLSPGIAYNYEAQFPTWSKEKIAHVKRVAPAALVPGSEHVILERNLNDMEDGDVIITIPSGKFRCPPAPAERASMIASFMEQEEIEGKVVLMAEGGGFAKKAAFLESWKEIYGDRIEFLPFSKATDVDLKKKVLTYVQQVDTGKKDEDGDPIMSAVTKTRKYEVLNLIPLNKANPVIEMAGLETTKDTFGKVKMNGCSFQTKTDADVYAVGDVVGHAIPPSGQTANWAGKECAREISARLNGKTYKLPVEAAPVKAGNVCYSMVGTSPEEAIMVTHDFSWTGAVIKGKGNVPKDAKSGKYRSKGTAKALRDWYRGLMGDLFS
ncbi:MAG: FAD-dependent oxidoreductase [Campylobacterota bacterium]|nr:FAD-dependent oxidoreductase [Campylobacterota bacterium]